MLAMSYDREAAAMMGIDIDRVIVFAFVLGSALAGAAGFDVRPARAAPWRPSVPHRAEGFTAAVIGGIGSIPGAMAGGLSSDLPSRTRRATSRPAGPTCSSSSF